MRTCNVNLEIELVPNDTTNDIDDIRDHTTNNFGTLFTKKTERFCSSFHLKRRRTTVTSQSRGYGEGGRQE